MNNKDKIILDVCGGTGSWSRPYKDAGYDVWIITLPEYDVLNYNPPENVYGVLAAPVRACLEVVWRIQEEGAPLKFWALENPMGYLYNFLGKPVYYFQPWWFGETGFLATKRTALWGYFNSPTRNIRVRTIPFISPHTSKRDEVNKKRENHKWYKASVEDRAKTPEGFAKAFFEANR